MWILLSSVSAVFFAVEYLCQKKLSAERSVFSAGWLLSACSLPFLVIAVFLFGRFLHLSALPWQFWWPLLLIWFVLYPVQTYFYVRALKEGEFSYVIPIMSILPVFNLFISWALLHEVPSFWGVVGILVTSLAVFILLVPKGKSPLKLASYSRAGLFMVIFCVCVAFGSTFDKIAIQVSEPIFYSLVNSLGAVVVLGTFAFMNGRKAKKYDDLAYMRKNPAFMCLLGLAQALAFSLYLLSYEYGGHVSYVLAIRSSSFVIAAFLGFLVYKEKITRTKFISLLLIILGLVCLSFA